MGKNSSEWQDIKLSARVFGHISQGLYRTPAGAIKELISNAFDADARVVRINTGFPRFDVFSCEDNGHGLSIREFEKLMDRGLGMSEKRIDARAHTPILNRTIIGRLGIGLLSLAQICTEFELISHHKASRTAFKVILRFPPYTREEMDKQAAKNDIIRGGQYKFEELEYNPDRVGVRIFTRQLRDSYRKRMSNLTRYRHFAVSKSRAPYKHFDEFINDMFLASNLPKALSMTSDYDQLVFGLGLIPPIPYMDGDRNVMLGLPLLQNYQERLKKNEFTLFVDNMEMLRPVRLPSDKGQRKASQCELGKSTDQTFELEDGSHKEAVSCKKHVIVVSESDEKFSAYEFSYKADHVAGRPVAFWGYLFQQTSRIFPRELQGVLVRIKDVAIGSYDNSMMVYPTAEGPRYSMISGELIVETGFEDALNIDRDSFNMLDPHYLRMQAFLHGLLHSKVFPEAWDEEKQRNKKRRERASEARSVTYANVLKDHLKGGVSRVVKRERVEAEKHPPVEFVPKEKAAFINVNHPVFEALLKRKKYQQVVEQVTIAFETSLCEKTDEARRRVFYELLSEVFKVQP